MRKRKAQTNMIMLVILLLVFIGIILLLFSLSRTASQEDYMNLYAHNMLLSLMRTDTGYSGSGCKLISDAVFCAFTRGDVICGDEGLTCYELANQSIGGYMDAFSEISRNYRYLLEVTPVFCSRSEEGCRVLDFGDPDVAELERKWVANSAIQKSMAGKPYNIRIRLYVART